MYSENPVLIPTTTVLQQRCGNYSNEGIVTTENIIPQSVFSSASPMVSDAHFITPTDGKVNGMGLIIHIQW
jgi:hypothetical protein